MEYKYELHCHTKTVSRCGRVEPKEIVKLYKEKGYSGIVLTDHYSPMTFDIKGYFMPQSEIDFYLSAYHEMKQYEDENFSVMLGMELRHYATANDYLVYGVEEEWLREQGNLLCVFEKKMYQMMHKQGYLVYQAHPFRTGMYRCNPKYVDGIEIYNGKTEKSLNDKAYEWAKRHGKLMVSGSDFHVLKNLARGGIITDHPIRNNAELLETLKSQNFKMIQNY
jgi:hypothetical protein